MDSIKVLIVDDSPVVRSAIKAGFRRMESIHVIVSGVARDGDEAIWLLKNGQPDVVTLDLEMPRVDGLTCLKKMKEISPDTRYIVISSIADSAKGLEALSLGADELIDKKDLSVDRLAAAISQVARSAA